MKTTVFGALAAVLLGTGIALWLLFRTGGVDGATPPDPSAPRASAAEPVAAAGTASRAAAAESAVGGAQRRAEGPVARLVCGKVVAAGRREPIAGVEVRLFDYARAAERTARTDASGNFAFPETRDRDGLFRLALSHAGYGSPLELDVRPAAEPPVYELLPGGVIRGRVVEAGVGKPVTRYRIQAVRLPFQEDADFHAHRALLQQILPENLRAAVVADVDHPDGSFELRGLAPGKFALIIAADGFQPVFYNGGGLSFETRGVVPKPAAAADPVLIELLPLGDVFLRVLDAESKEPILGAEVDLVVEVGIWRFPFRQRLERPDADGRHRLRVAMNPDRRIHDLQLTVTKPGYAPWTAISMSGQEEGYTIVALLGRGARVRGTVRDADRLPVAGCVVLIERDVDRVVLAAARTPADGTYELGPLPAETELVLHGFAPSLADEIATVPLELRQGEVRTVDLGAATAGAIFGRVTMRGAPLALVLVCLDDATPRGPAAGSRSRRRTIVHTGTDGRFRLEGLAPGDYEVFCNATHAGRSHFAQRFVTLREKRSEELSIAFGRVIRGVVLDAESDKPVAADARLELAAARTGTAGNRDSESAEIGEGGRFTMYVTEPAVYELSLRDSEEWFLENPPAVDLRTAAEVEVQVRARRDPKNGTITLRIIDDASGRRVENGWYQLGYSRSSEAGQFTDAIIEKTGCTMGGYRFVVHSDDHPPVPLEVRVTPGKKIVDQEVRLPQGAAVRVTEVTSGGNGWKAGLQAGDVITAYNGAPIRNLTALRAAIAAARKDAPVRLGIIRGIPMTLSPAPGQLGIEAETQSEGG